MKVIFLCLESLPLNRNIKLSNNKTKAILLGRIKRPIARLLLLLLLLLSLLLLSLLLKIPTDPGYCKRLERERTDRQRETETGDTETEREKERDPLHS